MVNSRYERGFTLVELIVVIALMSILLTATITLIDPIHQLNKAKDSKKQEDFRQIKTALDLYYDDNHCYPTTSLSFGSAFVSTDGKTTYMSKMPISPDPLKPYFYQVDGSSCPQWYGLYSRLSQANPSPNLSSKFCPLEGVSSCKPPNLQNHICVTAGNIDCSFISTHDIP